MDRNQQYLLEREFQEADHDWMETIHLSCTYGEQREAQRRRDAAIRALLAFQQKHLN